MLPQTGGIFDETVLLYVEINNYKNVGIFKRKNYY